MTFETLKKKENQKNILHGKTKDSIGLPCKGFVVITNVLNFQHLFRELLYQYYTACTEVKGKSRKPFQVRILLRI